MEAGMRIKLIEGLQWSTEPGGSGGLCNKRGEKVHLRQGDMDGACGPYCLVMPKPLTRRVPWTNLKPLPAST
eukprot:gene53478-65328_t